jgi:tetratricopeptide (TPR) repeat protein
VSHYNSKTGPKNLEAIGSSQIVSYVLMKSEQFDEAINTLTMELDKAKEVYGSESIQAAETMTNLATVYFYKNDFDKAEECYKKALHMYQVVHRFVRTAHEKQPLRVICTGLGDISYIRKDMETALQWYLEVERLYGLKPSRDELEDMIEAEGWEEGGGGGGGGGGRGGRVTKGSALASAERRYVWSPLTLCEALAEKRGYLIAKTGRLDSHAAGREILYDTQDGNVPLAWLPPLSDSTPTPGAATATAPPERGGLLARAAPA